MNDRLGRQLDFVRELDKLKSVMRKNRLSDLSRLENSAEHSWHVALMALVLAEHAALPLRCEHAVAIALVHDLVEIDAGDTFAYGATGHADKREREERAATRLFGVLPAEQARQFLALWHELEADETPEARFVQALDRLQPVLLHQLTGGVVWREHGVTRSQVMARVAPIRDVLPTLWPVVEQILADAVKSGALRDS
jgi:putative hydrolase of HD superfamily